MDIPKNHVVIPRGGRPPKSDKDIAIYLMDYYLREVCSEKGYLANEKIIKLFDLYDDAAIRKSIRKVESKFGKSWKPIQLCKDAVFFCKKPTPDFRIDKYAPRRHLNAWLWAEGMTAALQLTSKRLGGKPGGLYPVDLDRWLKNCKWE